MEKYAEPCLGTPVSNGCQQKMKSVENDTLDESNGCTPMRGSNFLLSPVPPCDSGEGLPYAPVDWPNPGDNWSWRVGSRTNKSGYYSDRFLYLPICLQNPSHPRQSFPSKPAVERYMQSEFPDADIDAFFASFSWKIPSTKQSWTKVEAFSLPLEVPPQEAEKVEKIVGKEEHIPHTIQRKRKQRAGRILALPKRKTRQHVKKTASCTSEDEDATDDTETSKSTIKDIYFKNSQVSSHQVDNSLPETETLQESPAKLVLEDFDKYLNSLQDILPQPLSIAPLSSFLAVEDKMVKSRKRLSFLLAMDFPSLVSSENLSELKNLVSELQKDPSLSADQLVKLKLMEEIPLISKIFLESKGIAEQADKFFADLEANKAKITSLKEEYSELKDKIDLLQTEVYSSSTTIQDIDDQIAQLQCRRAELSGVIEIKKVAKEKLTSAQKELVSSIEVVVNEVQLAKSQKQEWELKKENSVKSESNILARYAPLKGFSF